MRDGTTDTLIGSTPMYRKTQPPGGDYVEMLGETYYRIRHVDQMPPFFMSLVSGADHWLFIASNGGLTAGRINADSALFPYETEDKIIAHSEQTGRKTIVRVMRNGRPHLWEPFSKRYPGIYHTERNLYKNIPGSKLIFEEVNHDLQLTWRTVWRTGDRFGFIASSQLQNDGDACEVALLDGLRNVLPYGVSAAMQAVQSNLLHAYKRSELAAESGLGIFALSATLTDRAEPSESLLATVVWQVGLDDVTHLLSDAQLDAFRHGATVVGEADRRGAPGSYFVTTTLSLPPQTTRQWHFVADVNQDSATVTRLKRLLLQQDAETLVQLLDDDIAATTAVLRQYVAAADGLQKTAAPLTDAHHFANVMFNVMRGGIFSDGYRVDKQDLLDFIRTRNKPVLTAHDDWLAALPAHIEIRELYTRAADTAVPDLIRLCYEYLPLTFSRRHGDPSRPWNRFSINLKQPDGSPRLDYQGNWRDIFQNWEPLAWAFPDFVEGFIAKFLNATTADGYNPYRVTRDGIEWEVPEPENPWANIGYWSDHQIIYLQKLLEIAAQVHPRALLRLRSQPVFAYANVPYRLRPYHDMLRDWSNTIEFDVTGDRATATAVARMGTDGRLCRDNQGSVIHATMTEKLLTLLLAKLANLVPEGGIWMNTQRPEWNDANNALVGKGLSVVTTAYLCRFVAFWQAQLAGGSSKSFMVNTAVADLFHAQKAIFATHQAQLDGRFSDEARRAMMDALGTAATAYRSTLYQHGIPGERVTINAQDVRDFLAMAQRYIEHTLRANRRPDGLYHSYNVLRLGPQTAAVERLYLMLEGQVAVLSSGLLSPAEGLALLQSLRHSDLYRADQHSYMLYPNRRLPTFQEKNNVPAAEVADSELVAALTAANDVRLLVRDEADVYHFNGRFRNADDAAAVLDTLAQEPAYADLVAAERDFILELFEQTFNHHAFTGRSGTFFAYEGLGSIYWHMVSKLLLAAQELYQQALDEEADTAVATALGEAYYDIRAGIGFNKPPEVYGAFPTDPYSHTPWGRGAQQPGMTGQVKEEILTRWGELGVSIQAGALHFAPTASLLHTDEFLPAADTFTYSDQDGQEQTISLPPGTLAFTFCQTPIVYKLGDAAEIEVVFGDGRCQTVAGGRLDTAASQHIFDRDGQIRLLRVTVTVN